jgi:hypothetical protein
LVSAVGVVVAVLLMPLLAVEVPDICANIA